MEHIRIPVVREDVDTNVVIHFHVVSTNEVTQLLVDIIYVTGSGKRAHLAQVINF